MNKTKKRKRKETQRGKIEGEEEEKQRGKINAATISNTTTVATKISRKPLEAADRGGASYKSSRRCEQLRSRESFFSDAQPAAAGFRPFVDATATPHGG